MTAPIHRTRPPHWPRHLTVLCALLATCSAWAQPSVPPSSNGQKSPTDADVRPGERLSAWLQRQPPDTASSGLSWRVPEERLAQQFLKNTLLVRLEAETRRSQRTGQVERLALITWLQNMPVTGRVALGIVDPRWLEIHPEEDPILSAGQQFVPSPHELKTIAVVRPNGELCHVRHEPGRSAWDYARACDLSTADWAWIAQPDGRTARVGVGPWNAQPSEEPAPGSWIWAPPREMPDLVATAEGMIKFLATQGPSPQAIDSGPIAASSGTTSTAGAAAIGDAPSNNTSASHDGSQVPIVRAVPASPTPQPKTFRASSNDWGETGLLQTPSARMGEVGDFRLSASHVAPYTRLNFMFQPLDWLEGGFRYTSINNRIYGAGLSDQDYKDKSIDFKVKLAKESAYVPELALGFRDFGGTGLFSSEYLVASKRYGDLDFSLGIGWGNMGSSGNIKNPLIALSNRFRTRSGATSSTGGQTNFRNFFRGPAALFGGVEWRTPWDPLTFKLEYDGNNYQHEPLSNRLEQRTPFNFGLEYRYSSALAFSAGIERGNKVMVGVTLLTNLAKLQSPKVADTPLPRFTPEPPKAFSDWATTASDIEARTEWSVQRIAPQGEKLHVWITESLTVYREARVETIIALLHRDAPGFIKSFVLHYRERGLALHAQVVNRDEWINEHYKAMTPSEKRAISQRDYAPPLDNSDDRLPSLPTAASSRANVAANSSATNSGVRLESIATMEKPKTTESQSMAPWEQKRERYIFGLTPSTTQIIGGPDAFLLYQIGIQATLEYRFNESTWFNGALNWRIVDNFKKFTYTAPSNLPRVRTFQREYATTERLTMPIFQLTHVGRFTDNQYYSVYGGALEPMFAGIGAEWLYRPSRSRIAFGIDVNHVRQRAFEQDFGLRDYKVNTGHATLYWDTGWNGVRATVSVGQYLAGDRGLTLNVSKGFENGVVLGAYATKTNVSSREFGEGSFDKGIYVAIPFDAFLPKSSKFTATFNWSPLIRDGGAKLGRINPLYDMTSIRDSKAFSIGPPENIRPRSGDNILNFENTH